MSQESEKSDYMLLFLVEVRPVAETCAVRARAIEMSARAGEISEVTAGSRARGLNQIQK